MEEGGLGFEEGGCYHSDGERPGVVNQFDLPFRVPLGLESVHCREHEHQDRDQESMGLVRQQSWNCCCCHRMWLKKGQYHMNPSSCVLAC